MYIKKSLILSLFLCLIVSSAYASNIGRAVYSIFSESLSGAHSYDYNQSVASDVDAIEDEHWTSMECTPMSDSALEGLQYNRYRVSGTGDGWAGRGYKSTNSLGYKDMSEYYGGSIKFLARTSSEDMSDFTVGIKINNIECSRKMGSFSNFSANGEWIEYTFPLSGGNITAANLKKTNIVFLFLGGSVSKTYNKTIDIDYIRWVKPNTTGSFGVTVKNVSNNSTVSTTNITWASSNFQTGWKVAEQYLEIDYDKDSSTRDWNVKLYVNNGSKARNGLYATKGGKEYNMTMCWRASENTLPYSDSNGNHTLQIAEAYNSTGKYYYLYDSGSSSTEYSPWLYMQDLTALTTDKDKNYSTVMGYKTGGYHAYSGVYNGAPSKNGFYPGSKVALYLGANCGDAAGGLRYEGNIVVALEYE